MPHKAMVMEQETYKIIIFIILFVKMRWIGEVKLLKNTANSLGWTYQQFIEKK